MLCSVYLVEYTLNPNSMIEIVPELRPYGHRPSPNFSLFVQKPGLKHQSINPCSDLSNAGLYARFPSHPTCIDGMYLTYPPPPPPTSPLPSCEFRLTGFSVLTSAIYR